ncbi:condensation domain-containing protein [Nocardia brasiliensis]|uniref:condensation domain-containing protein n=1 Tax=Nocardia brasiliensis TaxID=37326 RepID=UPI002454BD92|nr:condensation domain-containing protein [Nocardia brasiliensis]
MSTSSPSFEQEQLLRRAREHAKGRASRSRTPRQPAGPVPLSHAQERMWLMDRLGAVGDAYHVPFATRLCGPLDVAALEQALTALVSRHEVLRTRYKHREGKPYQDVQAPQPVQLALVPAADDGSRQLEIEAARPFDLANGPVLRTLVLRHGHQDHTVLLTLHHIAIDAGSLALLAEQISALYGQACDGLHLFPEPAPRYTDFARHDRDRDCDDSGVEHWAQLLNGAQPVPLPRPSTSQPSRAACTLSAPLPPQLPAELRRTGQAYGATLFTVVLTAAFAAVREITGTDDIVIGCASSHRQPGLVGLCVNTLPVRVRWTQDGDMGALLRHVRTALLDAQRHRDTPFDRIVERLGSTGRDQDGNALVDVSVDVVGDPPTLRLPGCTAAPVDIDLSTTKSGLTLCLEETTGNKPRCLLRYDRARLNAQTAPRLLRTFGDLLQGMAAETTMPVPRPRVVALLRDYPEVADAAVLPREGTRPLAYVTPSGIGALSPERLRIALRTQLEPAAVPLAITVLDALPRTSDGNVDHAQLPDTSVTPVAAPCSPSQRAAQVMTAFGDVLGDIPGPDSDFFAIGGQSLTAVQVAEILRARMRLPLTGLEILEHRTPRALAELLDKRARQREQTTPTRGRTRTRAGTVLVTGATGGVGSFVVQELVARGRPVRALARPESAHLIDGPGIEVVEGELADAESLRAAASGTDAVIHAACTFTQPELDRTAMRTLLEGWEHGPFVFVSSIDAYGQPTSPTVIEGAGAEEPLSPYGRAKLDCEQMLWSASAEGRGGDSAVRAPLVWGPHPRLSDQLRWGATGSLFQKVQRGATIVLPADGSWCGTPWVHAAALARAIVACVEHPVHGVVNAISGHVSWAAFAAELARLLGTSIEIVRASDAVLPELRRAPRFDAPTLAPHLTEQPGEDWRSVIRAMLLDHRY